MTDLYQSGTRNLSFRVEMLDGFVSKGELETESFSISMDSTAEIKFSASLTVADNPNMDWQKNRIKITMIDGGAEYVLGTFLPQYVSRQYTSNRGLLSVEAYDLSILVQMDCITSRLSIAQGEKYMDIIQELLVSAGVQNVDAVASDAVFLTARDDWDIGTPKIQIVNQLLQEIGYAEMTTDSYGTVVLTPYQEPSPENIKQQYDDGTASVLLPEVSSTNNAYEIPNIFLGIVSNPDLDSAFTYQYVNEDPASKTSTIYTGCNKVMVLEVDNIASQDDLETYVRKIAYEQMQGEETVEIQTAISQHGVRDVIALSTQAVSGIFEEISWQIDSSSLTMNHTLKRTITL